MRPRFTLQKALLLAVALAVLSGLAYWVYLGAPLFNPSVPSTAGKIVFVGTSASGNKDLYLIDGNGSDPAPLTSDAAEDRSPSWAPDGQDVAFISDRRDGRYQVFLIGAQPDAEPRPLTITSSSKDSPFWAADGNVYYLASSQLVSTAPGTSDANAVFPTADQRRLPGDPLTTGSGLSWARPSPDSRSIAATLRLETGEGLLLSPPTGARPFFLGLAQEISPVWLADNTLAAAFRSGSEIPEPFPLPETGEIPPPPESGGHRLVRFGGDGAVLSSVTLPFPPNDLAVSPDGKTAAVTVEEGPARGVVLVPVAGGEGKPVFRQPATSPAWSPDGKTLAFVAGKDVWTVPADGSAPPKNLTQGKFGACASPVWSPARDGAR